MTSPCDDESYTNLIADALHGDVNNVRSFLEAHNVSSVDAIFHEVCHPSWYQTKLINPMGVSESVGFGDVTSGPLTYSSSHVTPLGKYY